MKKNLTPAALCLALTLLGCQRQAAVDEARPKIKVEGDRVIFAPDGPQPTGLVVAAVETHATSARRVTGRLVWDEEATVRVYSPVAGRVQKVSHKVGDRVAADEELARLDSPDFGQAQADARKAASDLLLAERTLARARELAEHGAVARKDAEAAENAVVNARSEQQRASVRLALFGAKEANAVDQLFTLKSPLAGVVVEKNLNVGQELRPDLMLANAPQLLAPQFVISEPRHLWVLLDVTEMDMGLLKPGQPLQLSSRALPGRTFGGQLMMVGDSLDPATRAVKARGSVDNADLFLKAEMYVDVEIRAESDDPTAVAVAGTAVFSKDDRAYVFVEIVPGTYERREVQIGSETRGKTLVRHGLQAGERVLVEGGLLVEAALESGGRL